MVLNWDSQFFTGWVPGLIITTLNVVTKSLFNYVHCDKNVSNAFVKNKTATKPFSKCYTSKLDEISHTSRHQQWQLIIISSLIIAFHLRNEDLRKLFPDKRLTDTHTNTTTHLPLLCHSIIWKENNTRKLRKKFQAPGENQIHDPLSSGLHAKHCVTGSSMASKGQNLIIPTPVIELFFIVCAESLF